MLPSSSSTSDVTRNDSGVELHSQGMKQAPYESKLNVADVQAPVKLSEASFPDSSDEASDRVWKKFRHFWNYQATAMKEPTNYNKFSAVTRIVLLVGIIVPLYISMWAVADRYMYMELFGAMLQTERGYSRLTLTPDGADVTLKYSWVITAILMVHGVMYVPRIALDLGYFLFPDQATQGLESGKSKLRRVLEYLVMPVGALAIGGAAATSYALWVRSGAPDNSALVNVPWIGLYLGLDGGLRLYWTVRALTARRFRELDAKTREKRKQLVPALGQATVQASAMKSGASKELYRSIRTYEPVSTGTGAVAKLQGIIAFLEARKPARKEKKLDRYIPYIVAWILAGTAAYAYWVIGYNALANNISIIEATSVSAWVKQRGSPFYAMAYTLFHKKVDELGVYHGDRNDRCAPFLDSLKLDTVEETYNPPTPYPGLHSVSPLGRDVQRSELSGSSQ